MSGTFDLGPTGPAAPDLLEGKPSGAGSVMASRAPVEAGELDYFPTPPWAARAGAELITRLDPAARTCWEPACGGGHMAWGLKDYFPAGVAVSDVANHGALASGWSAWEELDFLSRVALTHFKAYPAPDWIITNPPFKDGEAFIRQGWRVARRGVAMLLRLQFIEGVGRHKLFTEDCPLTVLAPFCERVPMVKGRWDPEASSATAYAWFIFMRGASTGHAAGCLSAGAPQVHLFPPGTKGRLTRPGDLVQFGLAETGALDLGPRSSSEPQASDSATEDAQDG